MAASLRRAWIATGLDAQVVLLLANVALYAICFQAQSPAMPYLLKSLTLSQDAVRTWGEFKSWTGALQVVGSLIAGLLIDRFGVKLVLLLSFGSSAVAYYLTAEAKDMNGLYLSQIPTVLQHAVLAARAYVAIVSEPRVRTKHLGYISVAYGIGVAVGPAVGGILAKTSLRLAASAAAAGSAFSAILIAVFLAAPPAGGSSKDETAAQASAGTRSSPWRVFQSRELLGLLTVKFLFNLALSLFHGIFSIAAAERFGLDAAGVGWLISFAGVVGMVSQGFLATPLTEWIGERRMGFVASLTLAACFAAFSVMRSPFELYVVLVPITIVSMTYMLVNTVQMTAVSPSELKGSIVAVDMALGSLSRMVAPGVGGILMSQYGFWSVGASSGGVMLLAAALLAMNIASVDAVQVKVR